MTMHKSFLLFISLSEINFSIKVKNCVQMRKKVFINILEESENCKNVKKQVNLSLNDYRRKFEIEMKQWNKNHWYETFTTNKIQKLLITGWAGSAITSIGCLKRKAFINI